MHTLVIGGTGMLAKTVQYLIKRGDNISLFSRNPKRLEIKECYLKQINRVSLDYHDLDNLKLELNNSVNVFDKIDLILAWIHDSAEKTPLFIANSNCLSSNSKYFHVLSSSYKNPINTKSDILADFQKITNLSYHQIILGYVIEDNNSRWLTHNEISNGVNSAIESEQKENVIGVVRPWSKRP